jgi:hypothetical protein
MDSRHLKHLSTTNPGREDPLKMKLHEIIVSRLRLAPFQPLADNKMVESAKDGRFNQSNCAIALYSNAYSQKAMFPEDQAPLGYLYKGERSLFSFGVYKRYDGGLFGSILPLTGNLETIAMFSKMAMEVLPLSGIYVRFLRLPEYHKLVSESFGFKPAKEEPWLPDAPEEDESLSHSKVDLSKIVKPDGSGFAFGPLRRSFLRGGRFLERNDLNYRFTQLNQHNLTAALNIIKSHFSMIEQKGKLVGSTHFDYYGLLHPDIISLRSVTAYLGFINDLPVSVFISEGVGRSSVAGYAGITLRSIDYRSLKLKPLPNGKPGREREAANDDVELMGANAIPTYAMARLFLDCRARGNDFFFMGGSEHADIDAWKNRQMGAEKDPTYWAILKR